MCRGNIILWIDGFVATNTTINRQKYGSRNFLSSGACLVGHFTKNLSSVLEIYGGQLGISSIIGCGDKSLMAWNAISNGATLVQLYSALVFQGPSVVDCKWTK